ncbi:hypothetical protein EDE12_1362 [Methylosinus sp. sav-2]|nr:hypothetical protein EDE12_1362 [Methylosinus sp. sav-2]
MDSSFTTVAPLRHGQISCVACFPPGHELGVAYEADGWRVDNNPGYWGAASPEVLVLGFSKGANQRGGMPFDQIAFNNARGNLKEILTALGFIVAGADIDACFTSAETRIGFASVVRCGLGMQVEAGKYTTSGKVVRSAIAPSSPVRRFFDGCTEQFLKHLPESVRVVVFLGLDRPYVGALFERMKQLHKSINRVSELAYRTEDVTFVHVIHPSPLATSHRQEWLLDDTSSLAESRREVCRALANSKPEEKASNQSFPTSTPSEVEMNLALPAGICRSVPVTEGGLENDYIRLTDVMDFFPADAVGGASAKHRARMLLRITFAPGETITTDIDGSKKILRERGAVRRFLGLSGATARDTVEIIKTDAAAYTLRIAKRMQR